MFLKGFYIPSCYIEDIPYSRQCLLAVEYDCCIHTHKCQQKVKRNSFRFVRTIFFKSVNFKLILKSPNNYFNSGSVYKRRCLYRLVKKINYYATLYLMSSFNLKSA